MQIILGKITKILTPVLSKICCLIFAQLSISRRFRIREDVEASIVKFIYVTLRDGGHQNLFCWPIEFVKLLSVSACVAGP